jgi:hypothetical protein
VDFVLLRAGPAATGPSLRAGRGRSLRLGAVASASIVGASLEGRAGPGKAAPHEEQKRERSWTSDPQDLHCAMKLGPLIAVTARAQAYVNTEEMGMAGFHSS